MLVTILSFLLLSGVHAARLSPLFDRKNVVHETEVRSRLGRGLQQAATGSVISPSVEEDQTECSESSVEVSSELEERRVLRSLPTANLTMCCAECQEIEQCVGFRRNQSTGSCELISGRDSDTSSRNGGTGSTSVPTIPYCCSILRDALKKR
eukprot:g7584.t1